MRRLLPELRYAWRGLARSPLFALVAVASLGVALALNTTMFALVDGLLHPPVPFEADGLYSVYWRGDDPRKYIPDNEKNDAVVAGVRGIAGSAVAVRRYSPIVAARQASDNVVAGVSTNFFELVGVRPHTGRLLTAADAGRPVAVISTALWRTAYSERPLRDGLTIEVEGLTYDIVGVMPAGMHVGADDVWYPMDAASDSARARDLWGALYLRTAPGVTRDAAQSDLNNVAKRLATARGSSK
jgi:hypothetical protein